MKTATTRRPSLLARAAGLSIAILLLLTGTAVAAALDASTDGSSVFYDSTSGTPAATLSGTVTPNGTDATTCSFQYATDAYYTGHGNTFDQSAPCDQSPIAASTTDPTPVSATVTNLTPGTVYDFQLVASNGVDPDPVTSVLQFSVPSPPTVDSESAPTIWSNEALLFGSLNPQDGDTTWHWEYVDDANFQATGYANASVEPASDGFVGAFSGSTAVGEFPGNPPGTPRTPITGLTPGTTYHYRLVATNSGGRTDGPDQTLHTASGTLPGATDIAMTSATLTGVVNTNGHAATYHFDWGLVGLDKSTPETPVGTNDTADHVVTAPVTGLFPSHTYSVRLVLTLDDGTTITGDVGQFTTAPPPAATTGDAADVTKTSATVSGVVDTRGLAGQYQFYLSDGQVTPLTDIPNAASGPQTVSASFSGLEAGRTYYYFVHVLASNGVPASGESKSFTTVAEPGPAAIQRQPDNPFPYGCQSPHLDPQGYAAPGRSITLTGTDLGVGGEVHFGDRALPADSWNANAVKFTVPDDASPGKVSVSIDCSNTSNAVTLVIPDNGFDILSESVRGKTGKVSLRLPGPGAVKASGKYLRTVTRTATRGGTFRVSVPLSRAGKRALKKAKSHSLLAGISVSYTPTGGATSTQTDTQAFRFRRR